MFWISTLNQPLNSRLHICNFCAINGQSSVEQCHAKGGKAVHYFRAPVDRQNTSRLLVPVGGSLVVLTANESPQGSNGMRQRSLFFFSRSLPIVSFSLIQQWSISQMSKWKVPKRKPQTSFIWNIVCNSSRCEITRKPLKSVCSSGSKGFDKQCATVELFSRLRNILFISAFWFTKLSRCFDLPISSTEWSTSDRNGNFKHDALLVEFHCLYKIFTLHRDSFPRLWGAVSRWSSSVTSQTCRALQCAALKKRMYGFKGRGKRGIWITATGLVFVSATRYPRTESRQMSQHVFTALFDKHPLTSVVQDGALNSPRLYCACFPSAASRAEGKEHQPSAFATTLSADDAHTNPAPATCSPHNIPSMGCKFSDHLWEPCHS